MRKLALLLILGIWLTLPALADSMTVVGGTGGGGGSGTVTNFSAPAINWPSWLTPSVATSTTTPVLSVAAATGLTSHYVLGTFAGTSVTLGPLTTAELPLLATAIGGLGTTTTPSSAQIPIAQSGSAYAPETVGGDATLAANGALTIGAGAVGNSKLANMSAHTYKGNNTGSTAAPIDVTKTQLTADLNLFTSGLQGLVPASGGSTGTHYLDDTGAFSVPAGGGGGSPGGSSGQTQYNNGGAFGGYTPSGDVTVVASTGVETIGTNVVTNAKAAQGVALTIKGNWTNATANEADNALTANQIPVCNNAGTAIVGAVMSGDVTNSAGAVTIGTNVVTNAKAAQGGALTSKGNWTNATANEADNALTANQLIVCNNAGTAIVGAAMSGDVTNSAGAVTIAANAVTNAKAAQAAALTMKGNITNATANLTDNALTANQFHVCNNAGTAIVAAAMSGDVTNSAGAVTIGTNVVTNTKSAQMAAQTVKSNFTNATANAADNAASAGGQLLGSNAGGTALQFSATPQLGVAGATTGTLTLAGVTSGTAVLGAQSTAGSAVAFNLPNAAGSNTNILQTDGSGNTSWVAKPAGGSPGGSNGQIQYDNSGAFGGFTASGDATINTGTGAVTLATVNTNIGTFAAATYNGKGLATAASNTLPSATVATTQTLGDNTTSVATDAFVLANAGGAAPVLPAPTGTTWSLPIWAALIGGGSTSGTVSASASWNASGGTNLVSQNGVGTPTFTFATLNSRNFCYITTAATTGDQGSIQLEPFANPPTAGTPNVSQASTTMMTGTVAGDLTNVRMWINTLTQNTSLITSATPNNTVGFRFDTSASDTTFVCYSNDTGGPTTVSSGITPVTGTQYTFTTVITTTQILYYINGSLVGTITTHIPTGSSTLNGFYALSLTPLSNTAEHAGLHAMGIIAN